MTAFPLFEFAFLRAADYNAKHEEDYKCCDSHQAVSPTSIMRERERERERENAPVRNEKVEETQLQIAHCGRAAEIIAASSSFAFGRRV